WHGSLDNLTGVLKYIGDTYHKYVMVAETAYPYTDEDGDSFGNAVTSQSSNVDLKYPISVEGQAQCLTDVFKAVADTGKWGLGVFYWEPAWLGTPDNMSWEQRKAQWNTYGNGWATDTAGEYDKDAKEAGGSSYDNQGLFDKNGKPLDSLKVFTRILPQQEKVVPVQGLDIAEGKYRIKNAYSGKYLSVINGEERSGASVIQYKADGAADYNTWYVKPVGDGSYEIVSELGGGKTLVLEFDPQKGYDYNTGISAANGGDAQRFIFVANGDNMYITTKASKGHYAIELDEAVMDDNGNVSRQLSNAMDNIEWILEPVEDFVLLGDLNGDGRVDTFDLIMLRQSVTGGASTGAADVNDDGETGVADLVRLERFLLGGGSFDKPCKGTPRNTILPRI
ncbi:MAG: glycosyl hydrolase 53 family protein, partial [Ruminococcus sp.]|nr:glycosyl hydrolase 53 family protein [Ruminococcus sp.]